MKYLLAFLLMIPAFILGCITWVWNPCRKGFYTGSRWLDERFNYGKLIENLLN